MKRVLAIFLAALMLAAGCLALAEGEGEVAGVDISALSDEDLLALRGAVEDEFVKRFMSEGDEIYDGVYVVGEDIAEGKYRFVCEESSSTKYMLRLLPNEEEHDKFMLKEDFQDIIFRSAKPGEDVYLSLESGMVVRISDVKKGFLIPAENDWAVQQD